jgi:hypothetical protein
MKRNLLNAVTALSLLLLVAVVVLWVRSHFYWESVGRNPYRPEGPTYHQQMVNSSRGTLWVQWNEEKYTSKDMIAHMDEHRDSYGEAWSHSRNELWGIPAPNGLGERLGFMYYRRRDLKTSAGLQSVLAAGVPYWLLGIVFAAAPARWTLVRLRIRRRIRLGLCPRCAYDLRATPGQCPECGASGAAPEGGDAGRSGAVMTSSRETMCWSTSGKEASS